MTTTPSGARARFDSVWEGDGRSFSWRATCGPPRLPLLRVHDQFADGVGFMDIRLRVPPRRLPALKLLHGAVRSYSARRWSGRSGYLPFGADVHAEGEFAGVTIPSRITAGWGHGTPKWEPFFKGEVIAVERDG
ncbi:MAG TPA: hypothetical protein VFN44_13855 [Solirubrobacteraceae bacterium]|nr:hypothetical protein [Solirubrobacteraceae bacterium]